MEKMSNFDNKLLKRHELIIHTKHDKNPSMIEAMEIVSKEGKADKELIAVKSIRNKFGTNEFTIEAFVYHDQKQKARVEPKIKVKKEIGK